jgi:phosphoribosylformylglycinamidine cyclo-ligase
MTGHGWRKLMRLDAPFVYRIETVPPPQPVFALIAATAQLDAREMYGTFNMGVGFAVYVAPGDADRCVALARQAGFTASVAGVVRREGDRKAVEIVPLGLAFGGETLHIR